MATRYVDSANGNEANAGTSMGAAWRYPPGMTGSTHTADVTSGDFVEIQNGSSYTGRRFIPVAGVTYRGYGLGGAQITIKKVVPGHAYLKYDHPVAREPGVHQGSWALSLGTLGSANVLRYDGNNSDVADVVIDGGPAGTNRDTVLMGASASITNAALRRACILNSAKVGVKTFALNPTFEEVQILSAEQDCMMVSTAASSDYGAGGNLQASHLDLRNPNTDRDGDPVPGATGDMLQLLAVNGEWKRSATIDGFYGYKLDSQKQAMNIHDCLNGVTLRNFHWEGDSNSSITIDGGSIRGRLLIEDGYVYEGSSNFHLLRLNPQSGTNISQILSAAGNIVMRRITINAPVGGLCGLITLASSNTPSGALDGQVTTEACILVGPNAGQAAVLLWKSTMQPTVGTLRAYTRGNMIFTSGSQEAIVLPPDSALPNGAADRKNYRTTGNFFPSSASFNIGSTSYSSVALFQAADAYATDNDDSHTWAEMLVDETTWGFSSVASPALVAGIWQPYSQAPRQLG